MSTKIIRNLDVSVKNKLLDISRKSNTDYNYIIIQYAQERFLYRLSKSEYVNNFILKGAVFLFSSSKSKFRQTKDIDFLGKGISIAEDNLKKIIGEISKIKYEDGLVFKSDEITTEIITKEKNYNGIRVSLPFALATIKNILSIDVGFGDELYKKAETLDYPTILDMESPKINAYSVETVIAEKFEAIVKLNFLTSRMKDFYDLIFIAENYELTKSDLLNSIKRTFETRETAISNRKIIYQYEFKNDDEKQKQWKGFLKRIKSEMEDNFITIINKLEKFIEPVFGNVEDDLSWNKDKWKWEK
jgi:predicted nucleotidyltransferase component of viral defense system